MHDGQVPHRSRPPLPRSPATPARPEQAWGPSLEELPSVRWRSKLLSIEKERRTCGQGPIKLRPPSPSGPRSLAAGPLRRHRSCCLGRGSRRPCDVSSRGSRAPGRARRALARQQQRDGSDPARGRRHGPHGRRLESTTGSDTHMRNGARSRPAPNWSTRTSADGRATLAATPLQPFHPARRSSPPSPPLVTRRDFTLASGKERDPGHADERERERKGKAQTPVPGDSE